MADGGMVADRKERFDQRIAAAQVELDRLQREYGIKISVQLRVGKPTLIDGVMVMKCEPYMLFEDADR